jgi:hypothetical protein
LGNDAVQNTKKSKTESAIEHMVRLHAELRAAEVKSDALGSEVDLHFMRLGFEPAAVEEKSWGGTKNI